MDEQMEKKSHILAIDGQVLLAENGLLLGNGDMSCSFYQAPNCLIWRFGKSDVWDRRIDYELNPKPAHIKEMEHGIRDEGWCCGPYGGEVKALKGTDNPRRMKEICQGTPALATRGYPCPKPVGELRLHLPYGLRNLRLHQELTIETGRLTAVCQWDDGVSLDVSAAMDPDKNVMAVKYRLKGYSAFAAMGEDISPVFFSIYRYADRNAHEYAGEYALNRPAIFPCYETLGGEPMLPPSVEEYDGGHYVEQLLPPEATYPGGLRCGLAAACTGSREKVPGGLERLALVEYWPELSVRSGELLVAVETSENRDELKAKLSAALSTSATKVQQRATAAGQSFWRKSSISLPEEPGIEECWYAHLHARRISCRRGFLPPGLVFASTLDDYALWHGDFHMNYNFQQPFYGDYAANHPEIGDSYFEAMKPMLQMGKLIAERYFDSTGTFIQLSGFPVKALDDIIGCAPMGRMAYATGWAGHQYFWRYIYTKDKKFLRDTGYPVLKGIAQFYLDFLKLEDDGKYHAFPSNQGEDGFTGNLEAYRDLPQIMLHLRFALVIAEYAAGELGIDDDFRQICRDRIARLADMKDCATVPRKAVDNWDEVCASYDEDSRKTKPWSVYLKNRGEFFPPEFLGFDGAIRKFRDHKGNVNTNCHDENFFCQLWYAGKFPSLWLTELRNEAFYPDRDWSYVRRIVEKWRMPNGIMRAMAGTMYGRMGLFTETTGIIAPIQETLLFTRNGILQVFPMAPKSWKNASFTDLRAEGGLLVSARMAGGRVAEVTVRADTPGITEVKMQNPFRDNEVISSKHDSVLKGRILKATLKRGEIWKLRVEG